MIKKINRMENYGRYLHTTPILLNKNTVIFGFNGMGKSTLSAIFYSLSNSEKDILINSRLRLKEKESDKKDEIYIEVETENDKFYFTDGKWNKRINNFTFNGDYIQDNVLVSNVTKRAGTYSVELDNEIIKLDLKKQSVHKRIEQELLVNINEIFNRYLTKIKSIVAIGNAKSIKRNSPNINKIAGIQLLQKSQKESIEKSMNDANRYEKLLANLIEIQKSLVNIPIRNFKSINIEQIKKTLGLIPTTTPEEIMKHISLLLKKYDPHWLIKGIYLSNDLEKCPFCGQDILDKNAKKFIKSLQTFANRKSSERVQTIKNETINYLRLFDYNSICTSFELYKTILDNLLSSGLMTKKKYEKYNLTLTKPLIQAIIGKLSEKNEHPFDVIELSSEEIRGIKNINVFLQYLTRLQEYIGQCENKLNSLMSKDKEILKAANLYDLSFSESREDIDEMIKNAKNILALEDEIKHIEKVQVDMREKIHLESISQVLKELNAKFSIIKENGKFFIKLRDFEEKVEYNDKTDQRSKYILSEGDQRALAFSYFLFELRQYEINNKDQEKIIIFDDPISSLDLNRKSIIAYKISELMSEQKNQIIVLSHDISFIEKLHHFNQWAKYYILTNTDSVVADLKIDEYLLSDSEIYKMFIREASINKSYENTVIALMSLRPLFEITTKTTLTSRYYKFSSYFNHSVYSKLKNYCYKCSIYTTESIRSYFKYIKNKVGISYKAEEIIPDGFIFKGFDFSEVTNIYNSIPLNSIMNARKRALLSRLLIEALMVKLTNCGSLKCDKIGKEYSKLIKKLNKNGDVYKHVKKIMEAYNQTKNFHHGSGIMLGLSWINPDEIEYYDNIVQDVIKFIQEKDTSMISTTA